MEHHQKLDTEDRIQLPASSSEDLTKALVPFGYRFKMSDSSTSSSEEAGPSARPPLSSQRPQNTPKGKGSGKEFLMRPVDEGEHQGAATSNMPRTGCESVFLFFLLSINCATNKRNQH